MTPKIPRIASTNASRAKKLSKTILKRCITVEAVMNSSNV